MSELREAYLQIMNSIDKWYSDFLKEYFEEYWKDHYSKKFVLDIEMFTEPEQYAKGEINCLIEPNIKPRIVTGMPISFEKIQFRPLGIKRIYKNGVMNGCLEDQYGDPLLYPHIIFGIKAHENTIIDSNLILGNIKKIDNIETDYEKRDVEGERAFVKYIIENKMISARELDVDKIETKIFDTRLEKFDEKTHPFLWAYSKINKNLWYELLSLEDFRITVAPYNKRKALKVLNSVVSCL